MDGIDDRRNTRAMLGRCAAILQALMAWPDDALAALTGQWREALADLARALVRNNVSGPQVQRIISLLDRGTLGGGGFPSRVFTDLEILRMVFEMARCDPYEVRSGQVGWYSHQPGTIMYDGSLPAWPLLLAGLGLGINTQDHLKSRFEIRSESEIGLRLVRVQKWKYGGSGKGDTLVAEKAFDQEGWMRLGISAAIAIVVMMPEFLEPGETVVLSGMFCSGINGTFYPTLTRRNDVIAHNTCFAGGYKFAMGGRMVADDCTPSDFYAVRGFPVS